MLPGIQSGLEYPSSHIPFYALKYQRLLFKDCVSMEIKADGFMLCSLVALTEDSKQYKRAPKFWTKQLMEFLSVGSRTTLGRIIDRCVKAGVLHHEPGHKSNAMLLWTLWPESWNDFSDGFLDEQISVQKLDRKRTETVQNADTIRTATWTHSYPNPKSESSSATKTEGAADLEKRLLDLGLDLAQETVTQAITQGTTPDVLNAIVDYYLSRPGAWGPGALRRRLLLGSAQRLPPDRGWQSPDRNREAQESRRRSVAVPTRQNVSSNVMTVDQTKAKYRQLELDFGPRLDALPPDEQERLLAANKPICLPLFRSHGATGVVRRALLDLLSTVAECSK